MRFASLFDRSSKSAATAGQASAASRQRRRRKERAAAGLDIQKLEERLALAVYWNVMPITEGGTSLGSTNFAYDIVIDSLASTAANSIGSGFGTGQDAFVRGGNGQLLLADNAAFQRPTQLTYGPVGLDFGGGLTSVGTLSTISVSSGTFQTGQSTAAVTPLITNPAVGIYRYTLPTAYAHSVSGRAFSSAGDFDFGAFWLAPSDARAVGVQRVTNTPSPNLWVTPNYSTGKPGTVYYFSSPVAGQSYLEFRFYSSGTGNALANVPNFTFALNGYLATQISNTTPQSFTVDTGLTLTDRLYVDLEPKDSTININSVLQNSADGVYPGILAGEPPIALRATNVNINQKLTSTGGMTFGHYDGSDAPQYSGFQATGWVPTPTSFISINADVSAASYDFRLEGDAPVAGVPSVPGFLTVSSAGSLTTGGFLTMDALYSDLRYFGDVTAPSQTYLITADGSADQYEFTTRDPATGLHVGTVIGDTLLMTLSSPQGGTVDLNTNINTLRFTSGAVTDVPYNYAVSIIDSGALTVDAVAASTGPIAIESLGDLKISGAAVQSVGDILLKSGGTLTVPGSVATGNGLISLIAPTLSLAGAVTSGGIQGTTLLSTTGSTYAAAAIRAGGVVRQSVRLASEKNYALASLVPGLVINGPAVTATTAGVTATNSLTITLSSVAGLAEGMSATGAAGIPAAARITSIDTATSTVTMDLPTTAPVNNGTSLSFAFRLVTGDRILLKNQTTPSQNGIYVVQAGAPVRASDASTSASFVSGMNVLVRQGSQEGEWTFQNVGATVLGTSALNFVPATATRAYGSISPTPSTGYVLGVDVATSAATGNIANLTTTGPATTLTSIDTVALVAGMRVLVKNQTNPNENGIYIVPAGVGVTQSPWARASDADAPEELQAGGYVYVRQGTQQFTAFVLDQDVLTVGSSTATFSPFAVQTPARTNTWSPVNVLADVLVATTANTALSGLLTIDGLLLQSGNRVLVKNQTIAAENGVYVAAAGNWTRADAATIGLRGTSVYVTNGTQNGGTSWQFDDSTLLRGTITAGSPFITGLVSNTTLAIDMLVTGPGIPSGTKIQSIGTDGTSVRLSANATLAATEAISFTSVGTVTVGTDPLVFIPTGGSADITATTTIGDSTKANGRVQAASALLSAGGPTNSIYSLLNVGRVSASAPGSITLQNSAPLELDLVRTTSDGAITASAAGTMTALSVTAASAGSTNRNVTLSASSGDVVVESVQADRGDISVTSSTGRIAFTKARRVASNVSALSGSVTATADTADPTGGAAITVDGRLLSQGTGDVVLASNLGSLLFTANANVIAADQLRITTPNSRPTATAGAALSAARLSLTSQFLAATEPLQKAFLDTLGTYQVLSLNRTDVGDILYTASSSLTVEGASTTSGSIQFSAPGMTVTGPIATQGAAKNVSLTSSAGNLIIDQPVTATGNVIVSATSGEIGGSGTQTTSGALTLGSASVTLASTANLAVGMRVTGTGIPATSAALPAGTCIVSIDSLTQITLSAAATATSAATSLTFTNPTALLTAPSAVQAAAASAARLTTKTATLSRIGTTPTISSANGFLGVSEADGLTISDVVFSTSGTSLSGTAAFNIGSPSQGGSAAIGKIDAGVAGSVTISAYGDIKRTGASDTTADILANTAKLTSASGAIALDTDLVKLSAIALQKNQSISINDVGTGASAGLELVSVGSGSNTVGVQVDVTSIGTITATSIVTAKPVTLKAVGASGTTADIVVGYIEAAGDVVDLQAQDSILEATPTDVTADIKATTVLLTATAGSIKASLDAQAAAAKATTTGTTVDLDNVGPLSLGGLRGNTPVATDAKTLTLKAGGKISQTQPITADTLNVTATTGADIALDTQNNLIGKFVAKSGAAGTGGSIALKDSNAGLDLGAITGGIVTITGVGAITQSDKTSAGTFNVTSNGATALSLNGGGTNVATSNAVSAFKVSNPGNSVAFVNSTGFAVAGANATALSLSAGGGITQASGATAAITVTSLAVSNAGFPVSLDNTSNAGFTVAGIKGTAVALASSGAIAQGMTAGDAILATTSLSVTNTGSTVILANLLNDTPVVTFDNGTRGVTYVDANGFSVAGIKAGAVALTAGGAIDQATGAANALTVTSLSISNTGNAVTLDNPLNAAFQVAGITGTAVQLVAAGAITQPAAGAANAITATSLKITNTVGGVSLTNTTNNVQTVAIDAGALAVAYVDSNAVTVNGITGGAVSLSAGGLLDQTAAITATSLSVVNTTGSVTRLDGLNVVGAFSANGVSGSTYGTVTFNNDSTGLLTVSGVTAGTISITTKGNLTVATGMPIVAGSATAPGVIGDGDILLSSSNGSIQVNANLTALKDAITINAPNGTMSFGPGVLISCGIFAYVAQAPIPSPLPVAPGTDIAQNGNITINIKDAADAAGNAVLNNGYQCSGDITIISPVPITISGLLKTLGANSKITMNVTGTITFSGSGAAASPSDTGTVSLTATGGTIVGASTTTISAATVQMTIGQALSLPTATITAGTLQVTATNGTNVSLGGANAIDTLVASSLSGAVRGDIFVNDVSTGLTLGKTIGVTPTGVTGNKLTVVAKGAIQQAGGVIDVNTLDVTGDGAGGINLATLNNKIGTFKAANGSGAISLLDTTSGLFLDTIVGGAVTITSTATGTAAIAQVTSPTVATITATTLDVTANGAATSPITIDNAGNSIGTVRASAVLANVTVRDGVGGLALGTISGNVVKITSDATGAAAITQATSKAITAATLDVTGNGGASSPITLANAGNKIGTFKAANSGTAAVSVRDSEGDLSLDTMTVGGALNVTAAGSVLISQTQVRSVGDVTIDTKTFGNVASPGNLVITGPAPGGLLKTDGTAFLGNVKGLISLVDGGRIDAAKGVNGNGSSIPLATVSTADELYAAIDKATTDGQTTGLTYEIIVASDITITQTLTFTTAVQLSGLPSPNAPSRNCEISAGTGVTTGVTIMPSASGSIIRNLAFRGFTANGILVNGGTLAKPNKATISGVSISDSGTTGAGLNFTGTGKSTYFAGSTVQNCTFTNNPYALRLMSAYNVTFGGTGAGQRNTIAGSAKAGVFASGLCNGSSVIKTVFSPTPRTPVRYNISSSRNLRIVQ
jgi:hypothetical protein